MNKTAVCFVCVIILLTSCDKKNNQSVNEEISETVSTVTTEDTNAGEENENQLYNALEKLQQRSEEYGKDNEINEKIKNLLDKVSKENLTPDMVDDYTEEINQINEMIDAYKSEENDDESKTNNADNTGIYEESQSVIIASDDEGKIYKLDQENDSISVYDSEGDIINIMTLTEDSEDFALFIDEKGNEYTLSEDENSQLILTTSDGEIINIEINE